VLVALDRSEADDRREGHPHRTPARLMPQLLCVMLRWFPDRHVVFVGDTGSGTQEMARFVHRPRRLTLVSKLHPDAGLYEPPPPYSGRGRPRVKGDRLPTPRQAAAAARRRRRTVGWYGGGRRRVETATGHGFWYKSGRGIVPLKWTFVRDCDGTHRDEYFFTTDERRGVERLIGLYTSRWNLDKGQPHSTPSPRWCGASTTGSHRRRGAA
jgi:DDE superfamily endonuclease